MLKLNAQVTTMNNFFEGVEPFDLAENFGTPLYVYNERIFRKKCREMKGLLTYPKFEVNFSIKANGNLTLLKIAREEGLFADAMSPGEIFVLLEAGFAPEQIFFVPNNVSAEEMKYALDRNILISVDSLSQLKTLGKIYSGKVAARFNPGVGVGHHEKVITAGKNTKFGINEKDLPEFKEILRVYGLKLAGINQHAGSLFMEPTDFLEAAQNFLNIAAEFEALEFLDFGGGFGIPYEKQKNEKALDLKETGERLDGIARRFAADYGDMPTVKIEPGRYICAESGIILGSVHAVKENGAKYIGTDIGFNVLARPTLYGARHEFEIYRSVNQPSFGEERVTIVGNICESGDILAKDITLPKIFEGDLIGVLDAGAYGYSMSSNYNNRLRPAEVLITEKGEAKLIRRRDTFEDLIRNFTSQ
jgi:diaminopimelate decarboxylase